MSIHGEVIGADDLRLALKQHLALWTPAYIAEVARQLGLPADALPMFRSYEIRTDDVFEDRQNLPGVNVRCDGFTAQRKSGRTVRATSTVVVQVFVTSTSEENATQLVGRYLKAVKLAVVKHPRLGGIADGVLWELDRYTPPRTRQRLVASGGASVFTVTVPDAMHITPGADEPPADPFADPGDWIPATDLELTVDPQERP